MFWKMSLKHLKLVMLSEQKMHKKSNARNIICQNIPKSLDVFLMPSDASRQQVKWCRFCEGSFPKHSTALRRWSAALAGRAVVGVGAAVVYIFSFLCL